MRASVLLLALPCGCSVLSPGPEPTVRMGGLPEADRQRSETHRATPADAEPGNALGGLAGGRFNTWQVSPRFDYPPSTSSAPPPPAH